MTAPRIGLLGCVTNASAGVPGVVTDSANAREAMLPSASITRTVNVKVPSAVGAPVNCPSAESTIPGGSVPPVRVH